MSRSTINQYISGYAKPKSDKLYLIAKALDVNEAWLMGYDVNINRSDYDNIILYDDTTDRKGQLERLQRYYNDIRSSNQNSNSYYIDDKTVEVAQKIKENKELRLLFDAAKDAKPEDLQLVHDMLLLRKKRENHEE